MQAGVRARQLIEPLALEREPTRNWCFYEYSQFSLNPDIVRLLGNKDRHFFIVTGGKVDDAVRPANLAQEAVSSRFVHLKSPA